jgi:hypothetical protein
MRQLMAEEAPGASSATVDERPRWWMPDPAAPLSAWTIDSAYDSAAACEAARASIFRVRAAEQARDRRERQHEVCEAAAAARARLEAEADPHTLAADPGLLTDPQARAELRKTLQVLEDSGQCAPPRPGSPAEPPLDPVERAQIRTELQAFKEERVPRPVSWTPRGRRPHVRSSILAPLGDRVPSVIMVTPPWPRPERPRGSGGRAAR